MIEHVVLSGGGPNGLLQMGVIQELVRSGHLDVRNLKSVYGTSAGAIICVILALGIPMEEFCAYLISRPWNKWVDIRFMDVNAQGGFIQSERLKEALMPMLRAYGFENITLKEAFDRTRVDMHLFSTELETFTMADLNHVTFPNLPVVHAAIMSAALFPAFTPVAYEGKHYVDGGLRNNFPINELLRAYPETETVLGINLLGCSAAFKDNMTAIETIMYVMFQTAAEIGKTHKTHAVGQQCKYYLGYANKSMMDRQLWENFLIDAEYRKRLVDEGVQVGQEFIRAKWAS